MNSNNRPNSSDYSFNDLLIHLERLELLRHSALLWAWDVRMYSDLDARENGADAAGDYADHG